MVKRIIKTTIFGIALSVVFVKILLVTIGSTILDSILRILSPLGVTLTTREFGQIVFTAGITSYVAYLVYTGKLDKYLPKPIKKFLG